MRIALAICVYIFITNGTMAQETGSATVAQIKTYGVKINVTDMDKAIDFYCQKLGFEIATKKAYSNVVELKAGGQGGKLVLNLVNNLVSEKDKDARTSLTFQVNDYDSAFAKLKRNGVDFGNNVKRKEGVGYAIHFSDPFGTTLSMMHVTVVKQEKFIEPKVYNYGILIPDMTRARNFFKQLGFVERSQRYLPLDMPLGHPDKTFGFMLHEREGIEAIHYNTANDQHIAILFKKTDLESAIKKMKEAGITIVQKTIQQGYFGKYFSFRDPFGLVYELLEENE